MSIKEKATEQIVLNALETQTIATDTTTTGTIIDTAGYDNGIYFAVNVGAYSDGTYTLKIQDGDNSALSDAAVIPAAQLIWPSMPAPAAAIVEGTSLPKQGIFGQKRYVRADIVSTATSSGADVTVIAIVNPEIAKTPQGGV